MPRILVAFAFLALFTACDSGGPKTVEVSGTITWNGAPLPAGDILFEPADAPGNPGAGKIVDGQYSLRTTPGKKKVKVYATRKGDKIDPIMKEAPRVQFIPAEYNDQTRLTADVAATGDNRFPFELTDGKKR